MLVMYSMFTKNPNKQSLATIINKCKETIANAVVDGIIPDKLVKPKEILIKEATNAIFMFSLSFSFKSLSGIFPVACYEYS